VAYISKLFAPPLFFLAAGCGPPGSILYTNDTTADALNEISKNTTDAHGSSAGPGAFTHDEVRQGMTARAAAKPAPH
jgi:hypothetical protein